MILTNRYVKNRKVLITIAREKTTNRDVLDVLRCKKSVEEVLLKIGLAVETLYLNKKDFLNKDIIKTKILRYKPSVIFNLFEGFNNDSEKEAEFVQILEEINIPFTGNSSYTLRICLDKNKAKKILSKHNILTPKWLFIKSLKELKIDKLRYPLFIQPCFEDASIGIDKNSLVTKEKDLVKILKKKIKEFSKGLILAEFVSGKEYEVGFLGNYSYEALDVSVLDYSRYKQVPSFLTYNSKWETNSREFKLLEPSPTEEIAPDLKKKILTITRKSGKILRCKGYFRVDLREKDREIFVLDVNPNPDINKDSGFIKQAYNKGYTYENIIEKILLYTKIK